MNFNKNYTDVSDDKTPASLKSTKTRSYRKSLVTDIYALGYGSGLLYNLAKSKTETDFNNTILGIGVGVAFFNSLDFNASLAYPLGKNKGAPMFNIGFDIKFTDYLSELRKKRTAKK